MMRAMTHYVHGNAGGRAIVVSPPGIPKATPYPIPLPESEGRAAPHRPSGNPNGTATAAMDVDQVPPPETPKAAPCPIAPPGIRRPHVTPSPRRESQGRTLPHRPSGNPKVVPRPIPPPGIPTGSQPRGWTWTNSPIRKRRRTGHRRSPIRESEGHTLPHPPRGIPTGFCHEARGCAAEALPREDGEGHHNPEGGCAEIPILHRFGSMV